MQMRFRQKRGASFARQISISKDGDPVDLTGATVRATVRTEKGHFVGNLTVGLTQAVNGIVDLTASPAATEGWTDGRAMYDAKITLASGAVIATETYGFEIDAGVTRG